MATVNKLHRVLSILIEEGCGEDFLYYEHDIIHLCPEKGSEEFQLKMKDAGAYFNENNGWYMH